MRDRASERCRPKKDSLNAKADILIQIILLLAAIAKRDTVEGDDRRWELSNILEVESACVNAGG